MNKFKISFIFGVFFAVFVFSSLFFLKNETQAAAPGCVQGQCNNIVDLPPYCAGYTDPGPYCSSWGCTSTVYPPPYCAEYGCVAVGGRPLRCVSYGCRRMAFPPPYCGSYGCTGYTDPPPYCSNTVDPSPYCAGYDPDICPLTVNKNGPNTVSGPGISCGSDCGENYNLNTNINLLQTPASGYVFTGWSGDCSGAGGCSVSMNSAKTVNANYNPILYATKIGTGNVSTGGVVMSNPPGIDCGPTCSSANFVFPFNSSLTLTAIPVPGYVFSGWQGSCSGVSGACSLTMNDIKSANALFYPAVVVDKSSPNAGTVVSSPAGINCGSGCIHTEAGFPQNSSVTLTATPASGYRLSGWRGACEFKGTGPCVFTASGPKIAVAIFEANLSVNKTGTGNGVVVAPGVECGSDCSEYYPDGFAIPVLANPFVDSLFSGWQGACAGVPDKVCLVPMDATKTVTAVFDLLPFLFKLPPNPPNISVTKKASTVTASNSISQTVVSGASKPVTLSVSGMPSGVTVSVNNNFCKAPCSSTLNFSVSPGAPTGVFPITVTGQADNVSTTTKFNMFIASGGVWDVRVVKSGTGSGVVNFSSNDPKNWRVSCGLNVASSSSRPPACSNTYAQNSNITITAVPDAGSTFSGWGGDCGGTGTCVISGISKDKNITVSFKKQ